MQVVFVLQKSVSRYTYHCYTCKLTTCELISQSLANFLRLDKGLGNTDVRTAPPLMALYAAVGAATLPHIADPPGSADDTDLLSS